MLSLRISLADCNAEPTWSERALNFGASALEVFDSPFLKLAVSNNEQSLNIWIGEPPQVSNALSCIDVEHFRSTLAGEAIFLRLDRREVGGALILARTNSGSCPIFVSAVDDTIYVSWRFDDVVAPLKRVAPDVDAARLYLVHGPTQTRSQVIAGVSMLWPGERLTFNSTSGLSFATPEPRPVVTPHVITESAQVCDALADLLRRYVARYVPASNGVIVEISGGLDSACVAIAAATGVGRFASYGLIHEGPVGAQQSARRTELLARVPYNDFEFPSFRHTPFVSLADPECSLTPFDDNHRGSCVAAVDAHSDRPFDLLLTGIGGDELTLEGTHLREPWELPGSVCTSSLVAASARADMFMRRGIWPRNPLIDQEVVDFCRALPSVLRRHRVLNRLLIARAGISDGFLFPRLAEHYGHAMQREAALTDFDKLIHGQIFGDYGIVDVGPLLKRAREASFGGFSYQLIGELFNAAKLEKVFERYVTH